MLNSFMIESAEIYLNEETSHLAFAARKAIIKLKPVREIEAILNCLKLQEHRQAVINAIGYRNSDGLLIDFGRGQNTCLHLARDRNVVGFLLDNGASPYAVNRRGETPDVTLQRNQADPIAVAFIRKAQYQVQSFHLREALSSYSAEQQALLEMKCQRLVM